MTLPVDGRWQSLWQDFILLWHGRCTDEIVCAQFFLFLALPRQRLCQRRWHEIKILAGYWTQTLDSAHPHVRFEGTLPYYRKPFSSALTSLNCPSFARPEICGKSHHIWRLCRSETASALEKKREARKKVNIQTSGTAKLCIYRQLCRKDA
jgi:hypothetical protein